MLPPHVFWPLALALAVAGASPASRPSASQCAATVLQHTRCPNPAYRWTNETSWQGCCATCGADAACGAFAYQPSEGGAQRPAVSESQGGNCHLKHDAERTMPGQGVTCGYFPGKGPPTPAPPPSPKPCPVPPAPPPTPPAPPAPPNPKAPRPHLVFLLQDDLGFDDVGWNNPDNREYTKSITELAEGGVILENHYVHWHCSPTRRSFLTGRLPIHHGEMLSGDTTDDIDLRWNILSQKLSSVGYRCLAYGKAHTGFLSMKHLWTQRGFEHWTGFMSGAQSYTSDDRWKDGAPCTNTTYATYLYGEETLAALSSHDPSTPLFLYLPDQAVHAPYDPVPGNVPNGTVLQQMLWAADTYAGKIVDLLQRKGMWEDTLLVYSADNGGTDMGTNYPKRGQKHTSFQGGMQVAAFVSGGFVPVAMRGTKAKVALHISDWYTTFCNLAGVDPNDSSPTPPRPICPSAPPTKPPPYDLYGNRSWAPVDGVDVWPLLLSPSLRGQPAAAHPELTLSREVIVVNGTWKLVVAQPDPAILATKSEMPPMNNFTTGWRARNKTWFLPQTYDKSGCGLAFNDRSRFRPCLFNLEDDPRETANLAAAHPSVLDDLWGRLNRSYLTYFHSRTPPAMLGPCNQACAQKHWAAQGSAHKASGPICGVPGCAAANDGAHEEPVTNP